MHRPFVSWLGATFAVFLVLAGCVIEEEADTGGKKKHNSSASSSGTGGSTSSSGTGGSTSSSSGTGGSTSSSSSSTGGGFQPPAAVQVEILDAIIAPAKVGGECWDGFCDVPDEEIAKVQQALLSSGDPNAAAAAVAIELGKLANDGWGPPDPLGWAAIWNDGAWDLALNLATVDNHTEDTFTPSWPGDPADGYATGWQGPFDETFRIRVELWDEDLESNDDIGVVEINYDDVVAALQAAQNFKVRVMDQGSGQAYFVGISAMPL
jgi:hypothetical protein